MKNKWGLSPIILLVACATSPQSESFRAVMERQVGKSADDSDFYPTLYRLRQTNSQPLPNGNVKEEYAAGRAGKCKVTFVTTPGTRRVVGWSADGDRGDCVIARPDR
jgi:hypothetical protein